jgi:hypothetical protein
MFLYSFYPLQCGPELELSPTLQWVASYLYLHPFIYFKYGLPGSCNRIRRIDQPLVDYGLSDTFGRTPGPWNIDSRSEFVVSSVLFLLHVTVLSKLHRLRLPLESPPTITLQPTTSGLTVLEMKSFLNQQSFSYQFLWRCPLILNYIKYSWKYP